MMDVHHFEMETAYGIGMRRLLNRLVTGSGVVCGLDVEAGSDQCSVEVTAGVAIDRWGREIVVPARTAAVPLPPGLVEQVCGRTETPEDGGAYASRGERGQYDAPPSGYEPKPQEDAWVTVVLCYHECETDPVAVLAGDCSTSTPCAPGAIREQYRIAFEAGRAEAPDLSCRFPDVLDHGELDYGALARWITRDCPALPRNPCIPLANVRLDCGQDPCSIDDIDITIRPVVFGNDVLVDILSRIVDQGRSDADYQR